ncbi:MAG: peptide chain release factor 1 [Chthoniobacterales bacterium]
MDFATLVERKLARFEEIDREIAAGQIYDQPARAKTLLREHSQLKKLGELWENFCRIQRELTENRELADSDDEEFAKLAQSEIQTLEHELPLAEQELQIALLPPEPGEDRDAVVEIRAGTGGTEAAIFAADLFRMYSRYTELANLKIEDVEATPSDLGGFRNVIFKMTGDAVFRKLRFESGVHRVQRVPATETQGRVHTSTATVAVLPEAEEVDIELKPDEIRIEVCRAGGPGGQGVNTTDSAVQVMHIPTGRIVRCQDGRSQQQNKERALQILRSRLLEDKIREEHEKYSAHRKSLIGSGNRNEKIRTYNFAQNRVTDHRIERSIHTLDRFLDGEIQEMIDALYTSDVAQRLEEARLAT